MDLTKTYQPHIVITVSIPLPCEPTCDPKWELETHGDRATRMFVDELKKGYLPPGFSWRDAVLEDFQYMELVEEED